jgi:hypothetical protein
VKIWLRKFPKWESTAYAAWPFFSLELIKCMAASLWNAETAWSESRMYMIGVTFSRIEAEKECAYLRFD